MTYTNIPPISYIFVTITTAILSYVTWAEMQEDKPELMVDSPSNQETIATPDETIVKPEKQSTTMPGGRKRKGTKKGYRKIKKTKRTRHRKLKSN
jgi:hypothetical protein